MCFFFLPFFQILEYLRICLWYSANGNCTPGDAKYLPKLRRYINFNYEESDNNELHQYLKFVQRAVQAKRSNISLLLLFSFFFVFNCFSIYL